MPLLLHTRRSTQNNCLGSEQAAGKLPATAGRPKTDTAATTTATVHHTITAPTSTPAPHPHGLAVRQTERGRLK